MMKEWDSHSFSLMMDIIMELYMKHLHFYPK